MLHGRGDGLDPESGSTWRIGLALRKQALSYCFCSVTVVTLLSAPFSVPRWWLSLTTFSRQGYTHRRRLGLRLIAAPSASSAFVAANASVGIFDNEQWHLAYRVRQLR